MFYIEDLIVIVRWLALIVAVLDVFLVGYILIRRWMRNRYYLQKDSARQRFSNTVSQFAAGMLSRSQTLPALREARNAAEAAAVQELLLAAITEENRGKISDLIFNLGYIQMWAKQSFGAFRARALIEEIQAEKTPSPAEIKKFRRIRRLRIFAVRRALPVANFSQLSPRYGEVLLYEALQDPSPYVTRAAVSALGKTPNPLAVPILLEQLRQASRGQSEIPIRSAKAALNRHANDRLQDFLPFLESEEDPFRLLVVDSIREMLKAKPSIIENFPPDLYDWFIHRARFDLSSDVRARSAGVIGCFRDANSIKALRALLLDENEYVRLHAARACGHPFYVEMVDSLVECMTDQRWRVRESAAKALASVGSAGAQRLADFFLATSDHYAKEQIADELQRSGLILQLVPMLGSSDPSADKAEAVCSKMVGMGMTSLFKYLLPRETSVTVRDKLLEILATGPAHPKRAGLPALPADAEDSSKDKTTPFLGTPVPTTTISTGR